MPKRHTVTPGDTVIRLADEHGHFPPTIWDHPDNAELKQKRKDMNVLEADDVVVIPDLRQKTEQIATEKRHRFRRKGMPALYRLQVFRHEKPRKNTPFRLEIAHVGLLVEGKTNDMGVLEVPIPAHSKTGRLWIGKSDKPYLIRFGHLAPADGLTGLRQRLEQIGFSCDGDVGDSLGPGTRVALTRFQTRFGLEPNGKPDAATVDKLRDFFNTISDYPAEVES